MTVGRRRSWYGDRMPARHALVRLGDTVPRRDVPRAVRELAEQGALASCPRPRSTSPGRHPSHQRARPLGRHISVGDEGEAETIARTRPARWPRPATGNGSCRARARQTSRRFGKRPSAGADVADGQRKVPLDQHQWHERQEHDDADDRPHRLDRGPACRHDHDRRRDRRRANGRVGRLHRPAGCKRHPGRGPTSTWQCSRRPAAESCCAASATNRMTPAC